MKEYNEYLNRYAKDYTNGDTAIAGKHAIVRSVKEYIKHVHGEEVMEKNEREEVGQTNTD